MRPTLHLAPGETQTGWTSVRVDGSWIPSYLFTTNRRIVLAQAPVPKGPIALFFLSFFVGVVLFENGAVLAAILTGLGVTVPSCVMITRAPCRKLRLEGAYPIKRVVSCQLGDGLLSKQSVAITFDDGSCWRLRDASRGMQSALLPLMLREAGFEVIAAK